MNPADVFFGFVPPQTFSGTPYNRAVYLRLQREVDAQQKEMDEEGNRYVRRSMSPVPPNMFFRDKQAYLSECAADFERENAAIKASQHARDPVKRMSAQTMMQLIASRGASPLTGKKRLSMLGLTPPSQFGNKPTLLARQFSQPPPSGDIDRRAVHTNAWNIQARHTPTSPTPTSPTSPTSRPSTRSPNGLKFKAHPGGGKSRKGRKGRKSRKSRKI